MTASRARRGSIRTWTSWLPLHWASFLLLFFLYVWLVIDPRLIHHSIGVTLGFSPFTFSAGWPFLRACLARPGGLVEYGTGFLSQLYAFGWLGASIVTAAAWGMCWCAEVLIRLAGLARGTIVRCAPAVLLLVIHGGYSHPLSTILALLAALSGFVLYLHLAPDRTGIRLGVLLAVSLAVYHVAGAGSLLFPALVAVHELLIRRRMLPAALALLWGAGMPWIVGRTLFDLPLREAYGRFLLWDPGVAPRRWPYALALYVLFPAVLMGAVLWRALLARRARRAPGSPRRKGRWSGAAKALGFLWRGRPRWALQMAVPLLAAGVAAWGSLDTRKRVVLRMDYYSRHEKWARVLEEAEALPRGQYHARCHSNIMLALHHTGRLGDDMFRYPQVPNLGVFTMTERDRDFGTWLQQSRILLDLGQVNGAEKCAYEALEMTGQLPALLEHLAVIHVVKGQPDTARMFLNCLSRNPFHRATAKAMLHRLDGDPRLAGDPRVRKIRSTAIDKDRVATPGERRVEDVLLALLARNGRNRMAFEFLMAHYLGVRRPDKVVANLGRLSDLGYREIPRHYQEAIIVHTSVSGNRAPLSEYRLSPRVVQRAREFAKVQASAASPEEAVHRALAAGLGDTYFFYFAYRASGALFPTPRTRSARR